MGTVGDAEYAFYASEVGDLGSINDVKSAFFARYPKGLKTQYASSNGLYIPSQSAWLKWRGRRANALMGTGQAHIAVVGDSIAHGAGVTAPRPTNSWPGRLRAALTKQYGDGGTGIVIANATVRANNTLDPRWTYAGGAAITDQGFGFHKAACFRIDSVAGAYIEFTANCSEFTVYNFSGTAGLNTATVDGGAAQTFRNLWGSGAAPGIEKDASYKQIVTKIPAGALGSHTLRITPDTTDNTRDIFLAAIEANTKTNGTFRVSDASISSKSLNTLWAGSGNNDETNALWGLPMVDMLRADLLIIALGINDWQNSATTVAQAKAWLKELVQRQKASGNNGNGSTYANGDVLLLWNPQPDLTTLGLSSPPWESYRQMYYDVAKEEDVPLLDLGLRWKDYSTGNSAGFFNDTIHPNNIGSMDIGQVMSQVVLS